jgi:hypothetical protein
LASIQDVYLCKETVLNQSNMTIRFAILAGVSTEGQAREDKLSIPDQIEKCRERIAQYEGFEAIGPFIMNGYSRSGYDSLDVAMSEIPPLGEAIHAAHDDQYDVLIMDNFDRLGDLGVIVKTRFKKLRKQLYSTRQSGKLILPDQYDPYASEDADIAMYVEGIIQSYRINKIRRGWNVGIPKRASDGLHPLCISYGYRVRSKSEPAEQIPEEVELIIKMKDWFLQGATLQQICERADASGVKPRRGAPRWARTVVKRIILNPYYAGIIIFGRYKVIEKKRIPQPPSKWVKSQGKHIPLWDEITYYAILSEQERRDGLRSRAQTYALTGLLECSICQTPVHRHGKQSTNWIYMNCSAPKTHIALRYEVALQLVANAIVLAMTNYKNNPVVTDSSDTYDQKIRHQQSLRQRVQEGFEAELYTAIEAQSKIVAAETEIERLIRTRERASQQHRQKQALLQFADQDLNRMRAWIIEDSPSIVNLFLTSLCEKIVITPDSELTVVWRE